MQWGIKASSLLFMVAASLMTIYLGISVFQILLPSSQHYALFICAVIFLAALSEIQTTLVKGLEGRNFDFWIRLYGLLAVWIIGTSSTLYLFLNAERLEISQPYINDVDVVIGILIISSIIILCFIQWGTALTGFITLGILYFIFGHLIDLPIFQHPEYSKYFLLSYLGMSGSSGIFWLARLAADNIFFIIIFANILRAMNMVSLFLEVGKQTGRWVTGGATFPAIIGSSLTGMVTGETVSNVVLTGRFTIPTMIKYGYTPEFAGAVEATAGSSGQIMPPIMGLSAFIMASFLNIAYIEVCKAAVLPAILYIVGITMGVLAKSHMLGFGRLDMEVDKKLIAYLSPIYLIALGTVVVLLLMYYTPNVAGLIGALVTVCLIPFEKKDYRPSFHEGWNTFNHGYTMLISLCLLLIAIGPLAQSIVTSNLNGRIAEFLAKVLPSNLPLILIGTAMACILIGMGSPTPVAYIMTVLIMGPFMIELGVSPLLAHFFVFYYATISALTPPVAPGALAAAKISGASYFVTGLHCFRLALTTLIIPFMFVYNPSILTFPDFSFEMLYWIVVTILLQLLIVNAGFGFFLKRLNVLERISFGIAAVLGILYSLYHLSSFLVIFLGITLGSFLWVTLSRRAERKREEEASVIPEIEK